MARRRRYAGGSIDIACVAGGGRADNGVNASRRVSCDGGSARSETPQTEGDSRARISLRYDQTQREENKLTMDDESTEIVPKKQSLFPISAEDIVDNALQNLDENQARRVTEKAADEVVRLAVEKRKAEYRS